MRLYQRLQLMSMYEDSIYYLRSKCDRNRKYCVLREYYLQKTERTQTNLSAMF